MHGLASEGRIGPDRPVVCASAGIFGQGVAFAGRSLGVPTVVFASVHANRAKVARMRALGAQVIEAGEDFDAARIASETYAVTHYVHLLVDGDEPAHLHGGRDLGARSHGRGRGEGVAGARDGGRAGG